MNVCRFVFWGSHLASEGLEEVTLDLQPGRLNGMKVHIIQLICGSLILGARIRNLQDETAEGFCAYPDNRCARLQLRKLNRMQQSKTCKCPGPKLWSFRNMVSKTPDQMREWLRATNLCENSDAFRLWNRLRALNFCENSVAFRKWNRMRAFNFHKNPIAHRIVGSRFWNPKT